MVVHEGVRNHSENPRGMLMINRSRLRHGFPLFLLLLCIGCNSIQSAQKSGAVTGQEIPTQEQPSMQPSTTRQGSTAKQGSAAQKPAQETISYATNPERFVKEPVYQPPFQITNPKTAEEHFDVGVNDDNQKQPAKAIGEYEKALALKPDWVVAHIRLARDCAQLGRADDAIAHWRKAIQYNPQFFSAYDELAAAYVSQGKVQKAIDTYSGLLQYPAAEVPVRYQLALWHEKLGNWEKARDHFERYRDLALKSGPEEQKSERFQVAIRELRKLKQRG